MSTISSSGKLGYIYDQATDTWHPIAGLVNTSANYQWSGTQDFSNTVTFQDVLNAKAGVNNFLNPTARDAAIPSPTNGIVAFVRQTDSGTQINELQYYYNGAWRFVNDATRLLAQTASYTLSYSDVGNTVIIDSASDTQVTVPPNSTTAFVVGQRLEIIRAGAGNVEILPDTGVTIRSKNSNLKIAAQYSGAVLIKTDTNTWLLIGDLTA